MMLMIFCVIRTTILIHANIEFSLYHPHFTFNVKESALFHIEFLTWHESLLGRHIPIYDIDCLLVMFQDFKMHNLSWIPRLSMTPFLYRMHQYCLYIMDSLHLLAIIASHMSITILRLASNSSPHILEAHSLLCLDVLYRVQ